MNNMPSVNIATFHFYNIRPQSSIITLQQNFPLVYLQAQQRYLSTCEITLIKTVFTERNVFGKLGDCICNNDLLLFQLIFSPLCDHLHCFRLSALHIGGGVLSAAVATYADNEIDCWSGFDKPSNKRRFFMCGTTKGFSQLPATVEAISGIYLVVYYIFRLTYSRHI